MLVDGDVQHGDDASGDSSSDIDSCMGDEHQLVDSEAESELICDKLQQDCEVRIHRLPLYVAFPTLSLQLTMLVERLSLSALFPGWVFRSEQTPRSMLFPGRIFKGKPQPNWTECTVPIDHPSVSTKLPGKVFSSCEKPKDHPSVSSMLPGRVFSSVCKPQWKWTSCTVPKENVLLSVRRPGTIFTSDARYKQHSAAKVPKRLQPSLSLTRVLREKHGTTAERLMYVCRVCHL